MAEYADHLNDKSDIADGKDDQSDLSHGITPFSHEQAANEQSHAEKANLG